MHSDLQIRVNEIRKAIDMKADEIIADIHFDSYCRLKAFYHEQEQRFLHRQFLSDIHPHQNIADWFQAQTEDVQSEWRETYHEYQYGQNGDQLIGDNYFSISVMYYLMSRDSYLKMSYCGECDSRGHETGACRQ